MYTTVESIDNKNGLKFSIVMPSFNQAEFIERSILSVIEQSYKNIELIIIDGGSTDGTVEIINKYTQHIAYWTSEADRGQSHALNKGFEKVTGDIFGWLNSDDLLHTDALRKVATVFTADQTVELVYGDIFDVDPEDRILQREYFFDLSPNQLKYEGFMLNAQATFWRKSLHSRFGKFDESLHRTMDYDMLVRMSMLVHKKNSVRLDDVLACFRRHPAQKTQGVSEMLKRELRSIADKNGFSNKYNKIGNVYWVVFRFRRVWWMFRREGLVSVLNKVIAKVFK